MSETKNTNVLINQIEVNQWNYGVIEKDFDIYQIVLDSPVSRNVLNTQDIKVRILSTVYYTGQQSFVLTRRGATDEMTLQYILNKSGEGKCTVRRIPLKMLSRRQRELRKLFGYRQRALLQLLINSTLNGVFPEDEYQNITGRCYYYNRDWNEDPEKKIELIDLTLERDMVMYPSVVTFTKTKPGAVRYVEKVVYDSGSMTIRKALKGDPENVIYYKQGIDGTHGTRSYDGTTLHYWEKSRMSCVAKFFRTVRHVLESYVRFDFTSVDTKEISVCELTLGDDGIANVLRENGMCLVDSTVYSIKEKGDKKQAIFQWTEESRRAYHDAFSSFCKSNNIPFKSGSKDLYNMNIEIVRAEKFYDINKDIKDPYIQEKNIVCQHVTVPVTCKNSKGETSKAFIETVRTVLKEVVVKADLRDGRIRLVDWGRYDGRSPLSFYCAKSCATDKERKSGLRPVLFVGMRIESDGTFTIERFKIDNIKSPEFKNEHEKEVVQLFFRKNFDNSYFDRNVELAVWPGDNISCAYIIRRTNIRAMSNILEMERSFLDEKEDVLLDTDTIMKAIEGLQDGNGIHEDVYYKILSGIRNKEQILKSELLPLLYPTKREGQKKVNICTKAKEAISNATGVVLKVGRRADDSERLGTDVYRHIHLWESTEYDEEDDQEEKPARVYCYVVGQYDTPNQSIATSPVVRQVLRADCAQPSEEFVLKLLEMMQVGFVRMKNYTVLPFPVKYIREILNVSTI